MERRKVTYKLYPTPAQAQRMQDLLRAHKDLWNAALQERIDAWKKAGVSIGYKQQCASLTQIRRELPEDWAQMNCSSQQITLRRLDKAFSAFFRRVKAGQTPGFPRFKSLRRMPGFGYKSHGDGWRFTFGDNGRHGTLRLQGIGHIKARGRARTAGVVKSCELMHLGGVWHLSLTVECEPVRTGGGKAVAADWGVEHLLSLVKSDGSTEHIENPRWFRGARDRIVALDQAVSRKRRGSKSRRRAVVQSARFKTRMARRRLDHHHKLSARIAAEVAVFATEELRVANMTASAAGTLDAPGHQVAQKSGLNREILDTAPSLLMQLIAYKVTETGGQFEKAPTRQLKPSQRCPACWSLRKKTLNDRWHACACGHEEHRDMAAARVVLRWAMGEIAGQELPPAA